MRMKFFCQAIMFFLGLLFLLLAFEPTYVQAIYYQPMRFPFGGGSKRNPWDQGGGNIRIPFGRRTTTTPHPKPAVSSKQQ
uniref:Pancreatic trypsin inhibitor n=1 Tax=Rhipicephalus appendiculatus TaxID=34631 RepID=A0A131YAW9_RHIAP